MRAWLCVWLDLGERAVLGRRKGGVGCRRVCAHACVRLLVCVRVGGEGGWVGRRQKGGEGKWVVAGL